MHFFQFTKADNDVAITQGVIVSAFLLFIFTFSVGIFLISDNYSYVNKNGLPKKQRPSKEARYNTSEFFRLQRIDNKCKYLLERYWGFLRLFRVRRNHFGKGQEKATPKAVNWKIQPSI